MRSKIDEPRGVKPRTKPGELDLVIETIIYLETESRRLAREACQRVGITATQLNVLKLLEEIGTLSLSELSKRLAAQNSTVTGIVDRMVQAELVAREQSAEDRRVWRIRLTDKGRALSGGIELAPWSILRRALGALRPAEKRQLVSLLQKVAANVSRQVDLTGTREVPHGARGLARE